MLLFNPTALRTAKTLWMQVTLTLLPSERPKLFERVLAVLRAIGLKLSVSFSAIFKKRLTIFCDFLFASWLRGYKTFFVLNSVEHEILNSHKYKNIKKIGLFKAQLSLECNFSSSYMLKCQQLLAF